MRWVMPTPKAKKSVSFGPLAGGMTLIMYAVVKSYSLSVTLYVYTSGLLMFLIMFVPVKKWVAADILKQEQNPGIKVKPHTASLVWFILSGTTVAGIVAAVVAVEHVGNSAAGPTDLFAWCNSTRLTGTGSSRSSSPTGAWASAEPPSGSPFVRGTRHAVSRHRGAGSTRPVLCAVVR
ncbi:hypothetical protein [Streptomyces colonosanans]|nr:hypothetical protein [Streptomyces colonosanans]